VTGIPSRKLFLPWIFILPGWGFIFPETNAQSGFLNGWNGNTYYHCGLVVPEYRNMLFVAEDYVQSAGLSLSKKTTGKNIWEQIYHYPEFGLMLFYSTLGNDAVNGREIALCPFFTLDWMKRGGFSMMNQIGLGLGYVTRKFDFEDNYQNIAVGSHFNIHFNLRLGFRYQLHRSLQMQSGLSFDHFSNANMQEPNLGINYLTAYLGLGYLSGHKKKNQGIEPLPHKRDFHLEFIYSFGGKHTRAFQTEFFFTSSGTIELKWDLFRAFHPGIGLDLFYDSSTQTEMKVYPEAVYRKQYDYRTGIHLSQEILYNRLSIIFQEGFYFILTDKVEKNVMYNRGMIRYTIADHFMLSLAMKSHLHILDYPEIGLGYRW
jgi:hypothetical protein